MSTIKLDPTIDDLIDAVAQLDNDELMEFEIRFEQLRLTRLTPLDKEAAQIAIRHQLPLAEQTRLRKLLEKNREAELSREETEELDDYITNLDQALEQTADQLLKLARERQDTVSNGI